MSKYISVGRYGLRYVEHKTRTTGVGRMKRPLRYYSAAFKIDGKFTEDVFGWEDTFRGGANAIEALAIQLATNRKAKTPPFRYKEILQSREQEQQEAEQTRQQELDEQQKAERLVFDNMFREYSQANKHKVSLPDEVSYHKNWISPAIGKKRLDEVVLLDLERIRHTMEKAGRAPQTIAHIKKIIRQVYHFAIDHDLYEGMVPTLKFLKRQKFNNKRNRYLTPAEVDILLTELRKHSEKTYQQALLSMHTGMRFGEIASLRWQNVRLDQRHLVLVDTKNKDEQRTVHMNDVIYEIFDSMKPGDPQDLVFPSTTGTQMTQVSDTFPRVIKKLGFNDGITDKRFQVVFHTLRHSCASWMANADVPMQVIAKVLGHKTLAMTMRYSHINDTSVIDAMQTLQRPKEEPEKTNLLPLQNAE